MLVIIHDIKRLGLLFLFPKAVAFTSLTVPKLSIFSFKL